MTRTTVDIRLHPSVRLFALLIAVSALLAPHALRAQPRPQAGKPFTLHYLTKQNTGFQPGDSLELLYVFDFWNVRYGTRLALWYNVLRPDTSRLHRTPLRYTGEEWDAVIDVPKDAALLSYVVSDGVSLDGNNERTYTEYVVGDDGKPVRNARFYNVQFMRLARRPLGELLREAEMEIIAYPDNFPAYHQYFSLMLEQGKGSPRVQQRIIEKIDELEKTYGADPEFLNMAARTYYYLLQDVETAGKYRERIPLDKQWPEVLKIYDRAGMEQKQQERSSRLQEVREKLYGQPFPPVQLRSYSGEKVDLPDGSGKPLLLCFWMQSSEKSHEMLRDLSMYHHRYGTKVEFVAVGVDRDPELSKSYLADHPVPFRTLHNQGNTLFKLGVESVPTTYLVDADGIIREIYVGYSKVIAGGLQETLERFSGNK